MCRWSTFETQRNRRRPHCWRLRASSPTRDTPEAYAPASSNWTIFGQDSSFARPETSRETAWWISLTPRSACPQRQLTPRSASPSCRASIARLDGRRALGAEPVRAAAPPRRDGRPATIRICRRQARACTLQAAVRTSRPRYFPTGVVYVAAKVRGRLETCALKRRVVPGETAE